jgi:hypothetical protein
MGIGPQSKSQRSQSSQLPQNQTYYVAKQPKPKNVPVVLPVSAADAEEDLPPSYDTSEADAFKPKLLLKPTLDLDLQYFHAAASGTIPQSQPSSIGLVMNLFRTTQTHLSPIDERMALGSSLNAPFYAIRSAPSSKSVDEFNLLTIARRNPALASWTNASTSEIQPRLNLHAQGVMIISRIKTKRSADSPEMSHDLTWDASKGSYTVWRNTGSEVKPEIDIFCEGWNSLDDYPGEGIIRVSSLKPQSISFSYPCLSFPSQPPRLNLVKTISGVPILTLQSSIP